MIRELKNIDSLNRGIGKRWIWGTPSNFYRSCDFLQKIGYSIHDLNAEINKLASPSMKEVIYIIVLIDWICEAVESLQKLLLDGLVANFQFPNESLLSKAKKYFKAIRSFVVAHPLTTVRHREHGLDGDFICVDVRNSVSQLMKSAYSNDNWFHVDFDGLRRGTINVPSDFVLLTYSEKYDSNRFFKIIGVNFSDLFFVAELHIEKLYALDRYLSRVNKKDYGRK